MHDLGELVVDLVHEAGGICAHGALSVVLLNVFAEVVVKLEELAYLEDALGILLLPQHLLLLLLIFNLLLLRTHQVGHGEHAGLPGPHFSTRCIL